MRSYEEHWNYTLTGTSLPYGLNNGSPYFSGDRAYFPRDSFINKDFAGYGWGFQGQNYSGSYALKFDIDLSNLDNEAYFTSLVYGKVTFVPALARRGSGIVLTWGTYTQFHNFYAEGDNYNIPGYAQGDFNGQVVQGLTGTLILMRRVDPGNSSYSDSAAHFISADGTHYFSNWLSAVDPSYHNQIGVANQPTWVGGYASISSMNVVDELSDSELEAVRTTGVFPLEIPTPTITPGTSNVGGPVTATVTLPAAATGWPVFYTLNNTTPDNTSTAYTGPITIPMSPGDHKVLKVIAYDTTNAVYSAVASASYTFVLAPPPAPQGGGGYTDLDLYFGSTPPAGSEYIYTQDDSDPTVPGNPAVKVWSPGTKILFGSWTAAQNYGNYALVNVRAATRYIATGAISAEAPAWGAFYFGLDQLLGLPSPGAVHAAISMTLSCASPRSRIFVYQGTQSDFGTVTPTEIANPGSYLVPWSTTPVTYTFYPTDEAGTMYGQPLTATWTFVVGAPVITPAHAVSLVPVDVTLTCPSVGAVVHYTLDGSDPTASSPAVTGVVPVAPGQQIKAVAVLSGSVSPVSVGNVLPEYEVTAVASSVAGVIKHHYYESTQRVNLLTELGCAPNPVLLARNDSDNPITVTSDDAVDTPVYMWDVEGSFVDNIVAVNGPLTALVYRPGQATRHWSRVCFSTGFNVDVALTFNAALQAWLTDSFSPLCFRAFSRKAVVEARVRIVGSNLSCTGSIDNRGRAANPPPVTITAAIPSGASVFHVQGAGTSVGVLLGAIPLITLAGADLTDDWVVEIETGAVGQTSAQPLASIPVLITTTASVETLRRAPLALVGTLVPVAQAPSSGTTPNTVDIQFNQPLNPVLFSFGSDHAVSRIGYSKDDGGLLLAGFNGWLEYNKYAVDTTKDFSVEVVVETYVKGYAGGNSSASTRPAHISLMLAAPEISRTGYVGSDSNVFAQYTRVQSYTDNQAQVRDANGFQRVNFREVREVRLRIARSGGALHSFVYIDGIWVDLGLQGAPNTVQAHAYIKFNDDNQTPMSRYVVKSMTMTGVLTRNTLTSPVITGIEMLSKGVGTGFRSFAVPAQAPNTAMQLVMNRATGVVSVESIQFEPTDTVAVLGVIETDHLGLVAWTPLVSSRTIRCRTEDENGFTGGYLIGAGAKPEIRGNQIHWLEAGTPRTAALGDLSWHAPDNQQHAWTRTRLIHGVDKHKITVAVVAGRA